MLAIGRRILPSDFTQGMLGSHQNILAASNEDRLHSYMPIKTVSSLFMSCVCYIYLSVIQFTGNDGKPLVLAFSGTIPYRIFLAIAACGNTDVRQHWFGIATTAPPDLTQAGFFPEDAILNSTSMVSKCLSGIGLDETYDMRP